MQIYQSVVWVVTIFLSGILMSCSLGDRILEVRDVRFDNISEVKTSTSLGLHISGQSFLNARKISDIRVMQEKKSLVVLMSMSIVKGTSGYIDCTIPIPNTVNEIKFGNKGIVIWRRGETLKGPVSSATVQGRE